MFFYLYFHRKAVRKLEFQIWNGKQKAAVQKVPNLPPDANFTRYLQEAITEYLHYAWPIQHAACSIYIYVWTAEPAILSFAAKIIVIDFSLRAPYKNLSFFFHLGFNLLFDVDCIYFFSKTVL